MAVKPSGPLNQKVDGGKVRDKEVEVEIQRLLYHLGGNQDLCLPEFRGTALPKEGADLFFSAKSVAHGKAGVKKHQKVGG